MLCRFGTLLFLFALMIQPALSQYTTPVNISNTYKEFSFYQTWAFDSRGKLHFVWKDWDTSPVYIRYATNQSGTWEKKLLWSNTSSHNPCLLITPEDQMHLMYQDKDALGETHSYYRTKTVDSNTWSAPEQLTGTEGGNFIWAAMDSTGGIYMLYLKIRFDPNRGELYGRYKPYQGAWGPIETIRTSSNGWPANPFVSVRGNSFYVTYDILGKGYYRIRNNGVWASQALAAEPSGGCKLAASPTGELCFVYYNDWHLWMKTSSDGGQTWSTPEFVSNTSATSYLDRIQSVVYDSFGDLHITWQKIRTNGGRAQVYLRSRVNGVWQNEFDFSSIDSRIRGGGMPIQDAITDRDGDLHICYTADDWYEDSFGDVTYFWKPYTGYLTGKGHITGVVRDQLGQIVPNATVEIPSLGKNVVTNNSGVYTIHNVAAGVHQVTALKQYYNAQSVQVGALASQTVQQDFVIWASPPGAVTNLMAQPSSQLIRLTWVNPPSGNLTKVMIRYKTTGFPTSPTDGSLAGDITSSSGQSGAFTHANLSNGTTYYYSLFSHDGLNHFSPAANVSAIPENLSVAKARRLNDGAVVDLYSKIVTAVVSSDAVFYISDADGLAGIRVATAGTGLAVGDRVNVSGTVGTRIVSGQPSERQLLSPTFSKVASGSGIVPVMVSLSQLGGEPVSGLLPGVVGGIGLNNIGMLVTTWGRVTAKQTSNLWVDDGSGIMDTSGRVGAFVRLIDSNTPVVVGDTVLVTGVIEGSVPTGWLANRRQIRTRSHADVVLLSTVAGSLQGQVTTTQGQPISGASISVSPGNYQTSTSANGTFTILNVPAGVYSVTATKSLYNPQTATSVVVTTGSAQTVNFVLTSQNAISGFVRDSSANPVSGAVVATSVGGYTTTSAADGSYNLANVSAGSYSVTASKSGYQSQTQAGVVVNEGAVTNLDFALTPLPGGIQGFVRDIFSNPVAGATVSAGAYNTVSGANGSYTITGVTAGFYSVSASKSGFSTQTLQNQQVFAGQTTTINFTIAQQTERLVNGNFEGGFFNFWGGTIGNNWGACWRGSFENWATWDDQQVAAPNNWVQNVRLKSSNRAVGIGKEITGLTPGSPYRFSADVYATVSGLSAYLAVVDGLTGINVPASGTDMNAATQIWKSKSIEGTVGASGNVTVYVWGVRTSGTGTTDIYFDNISFLGY